VLQDDDDRDVAYTMIDPPLELSSGAPPRPEPVAAPPDDDVDSEVEFELDLSADLDAPGAREPEPPLASDPGARSTGDSRSSTASILEQLEEAEFFLEQGLLEEAERVYRAVLELAPNQPQALLRLGELENQRGESPAGLESPTLAGAAEDPDTAVSLDELLSIPDLEISDPSQPPLRAAVGPTPAPPADDPLADFDAGDDEDLDLISQHTATPVIAARSLKSEPLIEAELTSPSAPLVTGEPWTEAPAAGAIAALRAEGRPAAAAAAPAGGEEVFDLAAALEDELVEQETGAGASAGELEEVFRDFKRGVRQQLRDDDADAHYDLAIAYKEMGLVEDALRELTLVQRTGTRGAETLWLMALCKRELGQPREAVALLHDALNRVGDELETRVSLLYDLGEALLAVGDRASSLEAFKKVEAADAEFRDVRERIASLQ
jgi:tetratricopeptide (TPR) repeat protein